MKKHFYITLLVASASLAVLATIVTISCNKEVPSIDAYLRNKDEFERMVARIKAGAAEKLEQNGDDFVVPDTLRQLGVTYVRRFPECIVFIFGGTLPPDSIPQIIYTYSERGNVPMAAWGVGDKYHQYRRLSEHWHFALKN
jgi:hypothetical protein